MAKGEALRRASFVKLIGRWFGRALPHDLERGFGLSQPQAYRVLHASEGVDGIVTGDSRAFLNLLRGQSLVNALQHGAGLDFGIEVDDLETLLIPPLADEIIAEILRAIRRKKAIFIAYTGRKGTTERVITPVRLVYVLGRYHVRGWDPYKKDYRDFVLARITEAKISDVQPYAHQDKHWAESVVLRFSVNPELPLSLRSVMATEWDLPLDGIREISCRRAHARYLVRRMTERTAAGYRRWLAEGFETKEILADVEKEVADEAIQTKEREE